MYQPPKTWLFSERNSDELKKLKLTMKVVLIVQVDSKVYLPGEGMMGCWLRKGCVSVGIWPIGVFVLRRPDTMGAVVMLGLASVFDCVRWGFMNCTRGSNPEFKREDESRAGTETRTGGGGTNGSLDWTAWGWIWGCGATGLPTLLRDWCGLFVSLLKVFFCCLGTSPGKQMIHEMEIIWGTLMQLMFLKTRML